MALEESEVQEQSLRVIEGAQSLHFTWNKEQINAMRNTVAKGATDDEFIMFLHLAKTYQLDPFKKEIWFIKMGGVPTIYASRDGFLSHAQRQPGFVEMVSHEVCEGDEFSFDPIAGDISHRITAKRGRVTMAYAIVRREGRPDHIVTVPFGEYFDALSAKNAVWKSHPTLMIRKVAEVINLKQTYGIHGLYAPEEMGSDGPPAMDVEYTMGDVVDDTRQPTNRPQSGSTSRSSQSNGGNPKPATEAQKNTIRARAERQGLQGAALDGFISGQTGKDSIDQLTLSEASKVIDAISNYKPEGGGQSAEDGLGLPNDDDLPF